MTIRKKGLVVNIASHFGLVIPPLQSLYGATKAFVSHFSKCIFHEYSNDFNIHVQCISPLIVATKMSGIREEKAGFFMPTPRKFVQHAICTATRLKVIIFSYTCIVGIYTCINMVFRRVVDILVMKFKLLSFPSFQNGSLQHFYYLQCVKFELRLSKRLNNRNDYVINDYEVHKIIRYTTNFFTEKCLQSSLFIRIIFNILNSDMRVFVGLTAIVLIFSALVHADEFGDFEHDEVRSS